MSFYNSVMQRCNKAVADQEKRISKELQKRSDDEIIRALNNTERSGNGYLHGLAAREANKRGL